MGQRTSVPALGALVAPSGAGRAVEQRSFQDALAALPLITNPSEQALDTTARLQEKLNSGCLELTEGGIWQIAAPLILPTSSAIILRKRATIKAATGFSGLGVSLKASSGAVTTGGTGYVVGEQITNAAGVWVVYTIGAGGVVTAVYPLMPKSLLTPTTGPLAQTSSTVAPNGVIAAGAGTGCTITPTYSAAALVIGAANSTTNFGALKDCLVEGRGILDGNMLCNKAVDLPYAQECEFGRFKTTRTLLGGFAFGSDLAAPASAGCTLTRIRTWYNDAGPSDYTYPPNSPGSIGAHWMNCTDNDADFTTSVGFRTGFKTEQLAGPTNFVNCHAWTRSSHGPMQCGFDSGASGDSHWRSYADTPTPFSQGAVDPTVGTCYGFRTRRFDVEFTACPVFINDTVGQDNAVIGFFIDSFSSNTKIIAPRFSAAATRKLIAQYGGNYIQPQVTIFGDSSDGNTYGSAATKYQRVGGYETHCMISWKFDGANPAITGVAGTNRSLLLQTSNNDRWEVRCDATAESGSDAGSNLQFIPKTDGAASKTTALLLNRATGLAQFGGQIIAGASVRPASYTVATLPIGGGQGVGAMISVSDGNGGVPCLATWNSSAWLRLNTGLAVSAT